MAGRPRDEDGAQRRKLADASVGAIQISLVVSLVVRKFSFQDKIIEGFLRISFVSTTYERGTGHELCPVPMPNMPVYSISRLFFGTRAT